MPTVSLQKVNTLSSKVHALTRQNLLDQIASWTAEVETSKAHIKSTQKTGIVRLNLSPGVNMTAESPRQLEIQVWRHIDVELDPVARSIASLHHNPDVIIHPHDIKEITIDHITNVFQYGGIDLVTISTPCQDLSPANVKGEGLDGKKSKLTYTVLDMLDMVKTLNPAVQYLVENVQFEKSSQNSLRS